MVSGMTNIRRYNLPVVQTAGSVDAADIAVVSKLLGRASIAITADLVGTVASDAVNGAANLIAHTMHTREGVGARCRSGLQRLEAISPDK